MKPIKVKKGHVLVMKTVNKDMSSHHDSSFIYPLSGEVIAHDFSDVKTCGNGIHAFLKGEGDGNLAKFNNSKWVILSVLEKSIIKLNGKVKFRSGEVVAVGTQQDITAIMKATYPEASVIGCTATAGDEGTATAGDEGTATAGNHGTAKAGDEGTATAGDNGTATAGNHGTAKAGDNGTATAGNNGVIIIKHWNGEIYVPKVAIVGENGIKPNTLYKLDSEGNFIEA